MHLTSIPMEIYVFYIFHRVSEGTTVLISCVQTEGILMTLNIDFDVYFMLLSIENSVAHKP